MIVTTMQLKNIYRNYVDPAGKISRDVKMGKLFPLIRGLYETDPDTHGSKLAQAIYGPSYLSFDYILYSHGLIPEAMYNTFTCATYNKNRTKKHTNRFGTFVYRDVPQAVFKLGVMVYLDGGYSYQAAIPEKALCDKLYSLSPTKNQSSFRELLFDDLRIDEEEFYLLNKEHLLMLAPLYNSTNLYYLEEMVKEGK